MKHASLLFSDPLFMSYIVSLFLISLSVCLDLQHGTLSGLFCNDVSPKQSGHVIVTCTSARDYLFFGALRHVSVVFLNTPNPQMDAGKQTEK